MSTYTVHTGDVREVLPSLAADSIDCCVTSPPYWGLRDYGVDGQMGLEASPAEYIAGMVEVFREVRRVLKPTGTCWVNMGDAYATTPVGRFTGGGFKDASAQRGTRDFSGHNTDRIDKLAASGLKSKDLLGLPWMLAFALRDDGWWLRAEIIWHKPNVMPESARDRPTRAHEQVFLLAKASRYFYDAEAIREKASADTHARKAKDGRLPPVGGQKHQTNGGAVLTKRFTGVNPKASSIEPGNHHGRPKANASFSAAVVDVVEHRNARTVWKIAPTPTGGDHYAAFPVALPEKCILAGCPLGGTVLDPFSGTGTTGVAALKHGRNYVGIELKPKWAQESRERLAGVAPLFTEAALSKGRADG